MSASKKNVNTEQIIKDLPAALLSWYPFEQSGSVLYIEGQKDYLYNKLNSQGHAVIVASQEMVVSEEFQSRWKMSFAYAVAIGCLEESGNPREILCALKRLLRPDGCMFLGVQNRLGLCYFCGERDPFSDRNFDGIENYWRIQPRDWTEIKGRLYAKDQIEQMLEESGFDRRKFYSVLPKLWAPQMLFAEDFLPKEDLGTRLFPVYTNPDTIFLEEEFLYQELIENGLFHAMANAYLIECPQKGSFSDVKQVTLSTDRGPEAAQVTILKEKSVEKFPLYPEGGKRVEVLLENSRCLEKRGLTVVPVKKAGTGCTMPYVDGPSGQQYLHDLAFLDKDAFIREMDRFHDMILSSSELIELPIKVSELLNEKKELGEDGSDQDNLGPQLCLKEGYIDLVPLNTIFHEGQFWILDQEFMEEFLPAAVIITRMVDIAYSGDERLKSIIPMEFFLKRYGLTEHLDIWRRKSNSFLKVLRNEKELLQYHNIFRRNNKVVHSNRQKIDYTTKEYLRLFVNIFNDLEQKELYLFGSGRFADQFLAYYHKNYSVKAILDNNQKKWGQELDHIPIESPKLLETLRPGTYKVIICIKNYVGVMKQLESMGVKDYAVYDSGMEYPPITHAAAHPRTRSTDTNAVSKQKPYHTGYIAGVFDLFHVGHLNLLKRAKEYCDYLIVGVVTDEGVRRNKKTNPFIPFRERLEIVESCRYVDQAVEIPLDFASTRDAYQMYHFDVQFSGSDYEHDPDWLAEKEFLEKQGAEMIFFPYTKSTSSTKLKEVIEQQIRKPKT